MKVKYAIIYAALAVAFVSVSLWVILSGGNNARAIKAKFRIGGLMLTIASMLTVSSCGLFQPTCYDTATEEIVSFPTQPQVSVGDVIVVSISDLSYGSFSYEIVDSQGSILQSGILQMSKEVGMVPIGDTFYRGPIAVAIYGGADHVLLGSRQYMLV